MVMHSTQHNAALHDEMAIRNLAAAYSHAVMRCDGNAAAEVYAEDGELIAFNAPAIVGRKAIAQAFCQTFEPLEFIVQTCTAGLIDIDGDAARASWSVMEWMRHRGKEDLGVCMGVYEDILRRTPDGWRFTRRTFQPFYRGTVPAKGKTYQEVVYAHNYAPWPFVGNHTAG